MAVVLLLAGCAGPRRVAGPVVDLDTGLRRLDVAIAAFGAARAQVLAATGDVVAAALALDAADEACTTGATDAAVAARANARTAVPKAPAALAALPVRLTAYDKALTTLAAAASAATSLTADQRAALAAVVDRARAESRASDAFRVAGLAAWPAYVKLDATQGLWLERRLGGWYRNEQEAAGSYVVLVQADRAALADARTLLERVDKARRPVSDRVRAALAAADEALAALRTPG